MSRRSPAERAAYNRWQRRKRLLEDRGEWQPYVDANPVREHLRKIRAAGMPYPALCARLGLPEKSLQHLLYGTKRPDGPGIPPGARVRRETAEQVLGFWPALEDFPETARIDVTGTRRRVQALRFQGWPPYMIAQRVGVSDRTFREAVSGELVSARTARAVAALYDLWWNKAPETHGVRPLTAQKTRTAARAAGFQSALAWDDEAIDDPRAVPMVDAPESSLADVGENAVARFLMGESVLLDREERGEAIAHLMEWTDLTVEQIAVRLESTPAAVDRKWYRIKTKAREEGRPVPWRRVFEQSYRGPENTNQQEMEIAA